MSNKRISVYGIGGFGTNIILNQLAAEYPSIDFHIIDSSSSNLISATLPSNVDLYRIEGLNGSGGSQSQNVDSFKDVIPDLLNKHKPATFNILLFSASGGTGSALGNLLAREFLVKDKNFIAVTLTTEESRRRLLNSRSTFTTMEKFSSNAKRPYICSITHQNKCDSYTVADLKVKEICNNLLNLLFVDYNALDESDLINFINYNRVCNIEPQLTLLQIASTTPENVRRINTLKPIVGYVTLLPSDVTNIGLTVTSSYDSGGFLPSVIKGQDNGIIYLLETETKHILLKDLSGLIDNVNETASTSLNKTLSVENHDSDDINVEL